MRQAMTPTLPATPQRSPGGEDVWHPQPLLPARSGRRAPCCFSLCLRTALLQTALWTTFSASAAPIPPRAGSLPAWSATPPSSPAWAALSWRHGGATTWWPPPAACSTASTASCRRAPLLARVCVRVHVRARVCACVRLRGRRAAWDPGQAGLPRQTAGAPPPCTPTRRHSCAVAAPH
jgi:hypothetical protein